MAAGSAQKDFSRTSPLTPKAPVMAPRQTRSGGAMTRGKGRPLLGRGFLCRGFRRGSGLLGLGLGPFLRGLAGLALLQVLAHGLLAQAGGLEEAGDAVGRLGAVREPVLDALEVDLHPVLVVLRQERVVGAELLEEAAVARHAAVGGDDRVMRALLGPAAGEPDLHG